MPMTRTELYPRLKITWASGNSEKFSVIRKSYDVSITVSHQRAGIAVLSATTMTPSMAFSDSSVCNSGIVPKWDQTSYKARSQFR